jgi:ATP-dependent RNA circularization protein (DNA/RNA ligase family)
MLDHEGGKIASVKPKASNSDLEAYFFDVLEDYDEERVYPSDIKKIIQWYNLLIANKLISFTPKESKKETKQTPTTKEK